MDCLPLVRVGGMGYDDMGDSAVCGFEVITYNLEAAVVFFCMSEALDEFLPLFVVGVFGGLEQGVEEFPAEMESPNPNCGKTVSFSFIIPVSMSPQIILK